MLQGRDNVFDFGFGGEFNSRRAETQTLAAQTHLIDRLFAGDIDDAAPLLRESGADLNEQRRFADAGLTAEQQHRSRHKAAAGHAVEFRDAAGEPRHRFRFRIEIGEREDAAFGAADRRLRADARGEPFFSERIPRAAGIAAALPAGRNRAAILTDKGCA